MSATAPVKLPRRWPKSSLSMSSDGIAPQLTGTKGASLRGPDSWISRATSSFPVPDSPVMCTGAWLRATRPIMARSRCIGSESPSRRRPPSAARRLSESLSAWLTSLRRSGMSTGFLTKSKAPSFSASTADSTWPWAVITATGSSGTSRLDPLDELGAVAVRQAQVREAQREVARALQLARAAARSCTASSRRPCARASATAARRCPAHRRRSVRAGSPWRVRSAPSVADRRTRCGRCCRRLRAARTRAAPGCTGRARAR